jgi:AraC-like DNA-binding protein/quercetin dioxygenase-like cupin family protein
MSEIRQPGPHGPHGGVIGLHRYPMGRGARFDRHAHGRHHQLAWASSGVLMVDVEDRYWVLPPTLAVWLPAGIPHATAALRASVLQGIYLDAEAKAVPWTSPTVLAVSPLARHVIDYLAAEPSGLADEQRRRAELLLLDVLRPVQQTTIELPMPRDHRARQLAQLLIADPTDPRGLDALGRAVGASARTVLRLFSAETGMTFAQWRIHLRMQTAMTLLAEGQPVTSVAGRVGYASPSAFVFAFRQITGHTPAAYFAAP